MRVDTLSTLFFLLAKNEAVTCIWKREEYSWISFFYFFLHIKMAEQKRYVIWEGKKKGIFSSWDKVKPLVTGIKGAKYKSFKTESLAQQAWEQWWEIHYQPEKKWHEKDLPFVKTSIAVDAACSSATGILEYQWIDLLSQKTIFQVKVGKGTNNIGEFLALVHGLAYLKENNSDFALYSDSKIAINWILEGKCKTNFLSHWDHHHTFELIKRAESRLANNSFSTKILKWNTKEWWEIPADFGRK